MSCGAACMTVCVHNFGVVLTCGLSRRGSRMCYRPVYPACCNQRGSSWIKSWHPSVQEIQKDIRHYTAAVARLSHWDGTCVQEILVVYLTSFTWRLQLVQCSHLRIPSLAHKRKFLREGRRGAALLCWRKNELCKWQIKSCVPNDAGLGRNRTHVSEAKVKWTKTNNLDKGRNKYYQQFNGCTHKMV